MILSPEDRRYLEAFEHALENEPAGELDCHKAGERTGIDPQGAARALRLANWGFLKKRPANPMFRITYAGIVALHPWREKKLLIVTAVIGWIIAVPSCVFAILILLRLIEM